MIPLTVLLLVVALAALIWAIPSPCKCDKCSHHVHERAQIKRLKIEHDHDRAHKGYAFKPGAPDLFVCKDSTCYRNPK